MASKKQLRCIDYHVAWICPVADVELLPARLMLDEEYPAPPYDTHYDDNTYICGSISGHAVVVATCTQGESGNVNAGRLTGSLFRTFPNVRMAVLVGIGGGIPRSQVSDHPLENLHLGDVVVGWPGDGKPACVYHDRGRSKGDGQFELVGTIGNPDRRLTNALGVLASDVEMGKTSFDDQLARLQRCAKKSKFAHPGLEHDKLFKAHYRHVGDYRSRCVDCDMTELVQRPQRTDEDYDKLIFHQGRIATGNAVIQDGRLRDDIGVRCDGALCVEMEAAGVDVNRQCLVIRGISDYADSHKNDMWRSYAAGRAAAFTRALLGRVQSAAVWEIMIREMSTFVQADYMHNLLLAPQGQASGLSQPPNHPQYASLRQTMQGSVIAKKVESHSSLKASIRTFQKLHLKEGIIPAERAGRFISELASILKSVSVQQNCISSVQFDKRGGFSDIDSQDLKRLRNIIKSSHSVCVNNGSAIFKPGGHGLTQKRSMQVVNIQGHEIRTELLERSSSLVSHGQSWRATRERRTETIAKIRITETSGDRVVVTAYIHYRQGHDGLQTLNPIISIGRTVPRDDPVFATVISGDVDSLRRLLAERRATLRDRDTNGTPLLHYATSQPEICKFLLENGADIDEIATHWLFPHVQCTPLTSHMNGQNKLEGIGECRRLLLEAGADPTLRTSTGIDLVRIAVIGGTLDSMKDVLDVGKCYINLNQRDSGGHTPLLWHARKLNSSHRAEKFAALLDRGADIHARDLSGRTCLHLAVYNAEFRYRPDIRDDARALVLLIERGADIFTLEYNGRSIFDDAYECDHFSWPRYSKLATGSYTADLWDHVLIRTGHEERSRPAEERIYHYTAEYTEDHFRLLWEGWEHLFPYSCETSSPCPVLIF
ncbi:hypothetical protein J1614_000813 [Plenodomus biglobosus]|nr:hypothetical protein J1614_000813 [Plenodomus biglobosus]